MRGSQSCQIGPLILVLRDMSLLKVSSLYTHTIPKLTIIVIINTPILLINAVKLIVNKSLGSNTITVTPQLIITLLV